jgi:hypothetical protein
MASSISDGTKKRGRPPTTGKGVQIGVRLQPDQLAALDAWIKTDAPGASRPEAIRRILDERLS